MKTNCLFCVENGKLRVIAENEEAILFAAKGGDGTVMQGRYLIIPRVHVESVRNLPRDWQESLNDMLMAVPGMTEDTAFNLSYNEGHRAGQRVSHVHCWVIIREGEAALPSSSLGMAALITELNQRDGDLTEES